MSVDALQFIDAEAAAAEIARILQAGGRAVITTWEALTEVEVPTVVRDYRPYFSAAGLRVSRVEVDVLRCESDPPRVRKVMIVAQKPA